MLFQRTPKDPKSYEQFREKFRHVFRSDNLEFWNQRRIYETFSATNADAFYCYAFEILSEWRIHNEGYTDTYIKGLDFIIKMLNIGRFLHTDEQNYLNQYREIIFAQKRNLKDLIVDFPHPENELIWYRYGVGIIYQNDRMLLQHGTCYFSNKNIIFTLDNLFTKFAIEDIREWHFRGHYLEINFHSGQIQIFSEQIAAIYVSFERIMRILKRFIDRINT